MTTVQFVVGIDYGTGSARGVLLAAGDGSVVAQHQHAYPHGVMDARLPGGQPLPPEWALQDADDYLAAAAAILRTLGAAATAHGGAIVAVGIDFTASTVLPTLADGTPLSRQLPDQPHAYVKLWKHHAAQPWAERINAAGGDYLRYTGGMTSCEWLAAKAAQLAAEAPALWERTVRFIEAGDWLVSQLVGREVRSTCQAGYKAHYLQGQGYPAEFDQLAPGLRERLAEPLPVGTAAGTLSAAWVDRLGLSQAPVVAVATVDAHAVVPAVGVDRPGVLVVSIGTSACHLMVDEACHCIPGVAGVVRDGILPGLWGYEAGQAGFGDLLAWFVRQFPISGDSDADFASYNQAAAALPAAGSGVLALDWWNGCRTPYMDPGLSGLFVGMTLQTTRAELYRALLESLCYGTRRIIDTLTDGGLAIGELVITSGLAEKNPHLVQLLAEVTGRSVRVPEVTEATARGAAIHGAVAAGIVADFAAGVSRFGAQRTRTVTPADAAVARYQQLYRIYRELSAQFAESSDTMATLRRLRGQPTA